MTDQTHGHSATGEPKAEPDEAQLRRLFADYSTRFEPDQAKISSQLQERLQSASRRAVLDAKPMGFAAVVMAVAVVVSVMTLVDGPWADQRVKTVDGVGIAEPAASERTDGAVAGSAQQRDQSQGLAGGEERSVSTAMAAFAPSTSTLLVEQQGDTPPSTVSGPPAGVGSSVGTETVPSTVGAGSPSPSTTVPTAGAGSPPSSAVTSPGRSSATVRATIASTNSNGSTTSQPSNANPPETRPRPFETIPPARLSTSTTALTATVPLTGLTTSASPLTTTSTSLSTTTSSSAPAATETAAAVGVELQVSVAPLPSRIRFSAAGYIDWAVAGSRNDGKIITLANRDPSIRIRAVGHDLDRKPAPIEILWTDGQSEERRDINDTWWSAPAFPTVFVVSNDGDESPESIQLYLGGSADLSVTVTVGEVGSASVTVPSPGRVVTVDLGPQAQNNPFVITIGAPFGSGTVALGAVAFS